MCRHNQWQIQVAWADLPQVLACDPAWVSEPQALGCIDAEANDLSNKPARQSKSLRQAVLVTGHQTELTQPVLVRRN